MWRRHPDPRAIEAAVRANMAHWSVLDADERARLLDGAGRLLARKHWEAAGGLELDDTVLGVVAGLASLLVLGRDVDDLREVSAVITYPSGVVTAGTWAGPVPGTLVEGHTRAHGLAVGRRGPVIIAWDQALAAARDPARNHNVVLHEFAHKLDALDGLMDGTPPLARSVRARWIAVCQALMDDLRAGNPHPPLRLYAATNPSEFFAVATESFFDRPLDLRAAEPELYDVLRSYYLQDPAARAGRPAA